MKIFQISLILAILIISACKKNEIVKTTTNSDLTNQLEKIYKQSELSGFSVVVVSDGSVYYKKSFGFSDVENKKPYQNNTVQNIASISKTFIALALMKAVEQGKMNLDDDINKHLPFKVEHHYYPEKVITVRHLTNHTSGIVDSEVYNKSYVLLNPDQVDFENASDLMKQELNDIKDSKMIDDSEYFKNALSKQGKWYTSDSFSNNEPGTNESYSNIAAALAAYIVENATGMSYENYTRKFIFEPLSMQQSGWDDSDYNQDNFATRYFPKNEVVPDYHLITLADGAVKTTANDFAKYMQEILKGAQGNGTLLSAKSYQELTKVSSKEVSNNAIFWEIKKDGTLNHNGADPGVFTITKINVDKNIAFYLATNMSAYMDKDLIGSIKNILKTIKAHNWEKN